MRAIRPILCATLIAMVPLVGSAGPADAHTGFESFNPANDATIGLPTERGAEVYDQSYTSCSGTDKGISHDDIEVVIAYVRAEQQWFGSEA